jgi:hypothetical protein
MSSATERFLIVSECRAKSLALEILGIWIYFGPSYDPEIFSNCLEVDFASGAERLCEKYRQRFQITPVALELDLYDALRLDVHLDGALPSAGNSHRSVCDRRRHLGYFHGVCLLKGV